MPVKASSSHAQLRANALDGNRPKPQWAQVLTDQATIVACDSFPVDTVALRRV